MPEILWYWKKGEINFFTRRMDVVDKAIQEGSQVLPVQQKSRIFLPPQR